MRDKACFWNALRVASARPGLRYTEGFALTHFGWCHHAWIVNGQDHAIEVTWAEPGERYIGVPFTSTNDVLAAMENHQGLGGPAFQLRSGDEYAWRPPNELKPTNHSGRHRSI